MIPGANVKIRHNRMIGANIDRGQEPRFILNSLEFSEKPRST
jgi:hypothetical protein